MTLYPQRTLVLPKELVGQVNGGLPDSLLVKIDSGPGKMAPTPARGMRALMAACRAATGLLLSYTSIAYRSWDMQVAVLKARAVPDVPQGGTWQRTWNGHVWYGKPGTAPVAVPGQSNHGLGRAIDIAWLDASGQPTVGITDRPQWSWILSHALDYGYCWESDAEPWHLAWFPGDNIPAAVLAFEQPQGVHMGYIYKGTSALTGGSWPYTNIGDAAWMPAFVPPMVPTTQVVNGTAKQVPGGYVLVRIDDGNFLGVMNQGGEVKTIDQGILDKAKKVRTEDYGAYLASLVGSGAPVDLSNLATHADVAAVPAATVALIPPSSGGSGPPPNYLVELQGEVDLNTRQISLTGESAPVT